MNIVTPSEMEQIDRETIDDHGLHSLVLMENAARSVVPYLPDGRVGILVGPGNNGGDGLVLARVLAELGRDVEILLLSRKLSPDAERNLHLARQWKVPCHTLYKDQKPGICRDFLKNKDVVLDALFGTGLCRDLEGRWKQLVEMVNASRVTVVAVDIPSGINGANGQVMGTALRADVTVTFGCLKRGHILMPGRQHCGQVRLTQPGFHPEALNRHRKVKLMNGEMAARALPKIWPTMHKGDNGRLLMVTGSEQYPGAGILSTLGALHAGCGLLTHWWPEELRQCLLQWAPEAMPVSRSQDVSWDGFNAVVLGSGLGKEAERLCGGLLRDCHLPKVVDADALSLVESLSEEQRKSLVLTPHPGELSRLVGRPAKTLEQDRIDSAIEAARELGAVVCFKGAPTVTAAPDGRVYINGSGNPVLAQGGTGDVLAGMVGAYLAYGLPLLEAAACAAFVHGRAGDMAVKQIGPRGATAHRIAKLVPFAYAEIVGNP
jgi:hydroxyethylthiazole kinase-like uncharacterized protein yjeF